MDVTEVSAEQSATASAGVPGYLEIMGHRRLAGIVSEEQRLGRVMVRIDIPASQDGQIEPQTQYYSPESVFCFTPMEPEKAARLAETLRYRAVAPWELGESSGSTLPLLDRASSRSRAWDEDEDDKDNSYYENPFDD